MSEPLANRSILLGVSGSIAAYKAADLCSQLSKNGAEVHVVLTQHAAEFVGVPTFRALTRNPVLTAVFDEPYARRIAHIDLAQSADLVLVAPASANTLAKMAHGLADDLLSTCLLATPPTTPLLVAPAMNTIMWEHPATRQNLQTLVRRGVEVVPPGEGLLACQDVGTGKLADVTDIVEAVVRRLTLPQDFAGKRVLLTAGATREPLDPVRFLTNHSSGKMGFAIAEAARQRGANVTVLTGAVSVPVPAGVEIVPVESAAEMYRAALAHFPACDIFIAAAAVADFRPETVAAGKIKKQPGQDVLTLRLVRNPDIVATLAAQKRPDQQVIGFAAETENLLDNAFRKLREKNLTLLVANDVTREGAGFGTDTNIVTFLWPDGKTEALPLLAKHQVAHKLLDALTHNA